MGTYQSKYTGEQIDNGINPVGTIISFMGLVAPNGYLICDGTELNIADYSALATHFETQFGTKNHFGGDGTTTFALPDLRNEFLRGYHGEASEQLSSEVGMHQDATEHMRIATQNSSHQVQTYSLSDTEWLSPSGEDTSIYSNNTVWAMHSSTGNGDGSTVPYAYTSRPTNVAVLYCIKF